MGQLDAWASSTGAVTPRGSLEPEGPRNHVEAFDAFVGIVRDAAVCYSHHVSRTEKGKNCPDRLAACFFTLKAVMRRYAR